jgi:hypothetical protein
VTSEQDGRADDLAALDNVLRRLLLVDSLTSQELLIDCEIIAAKDDAVSRQHVALHKPHQPPSPKCTL